MLRIILAVVLVLHGGIHLLGVVKAFSPGALTEMRPIAWPLGVLWLIAALALVGCAILVIAGSQAWMIALGPALLVSTIVIVAAWSDAKVGALVNLVLLVALGLAIRERPTLRALYDAETSARMTRAIAASSVVEESDLAQLPPLVGAYLRRAGVVGKPRVMDLSARFSGEMRTSADAAWMPIQAQQRSFFEEPARLFYMEAKRSGLPFAALHVYAGGTATMVVRVAGLADVVDARGPEMDQGETVTLFNDMWLLAPATLVDAPIVWETIDPRTVGAVFRGIHATLTFDEAGDLAEFWSDDRYQSADGKTYAKLRWTTPVREHRDLGAARVASLAEAIWREADGRTWTYARFRVESLEYNTRPAPEHRSADVTAR